MWPLRITMFVCSAASHGTAELNYCVMFGEVRMYTKSGVCKRGRLEICGLFQTLAYTQFFILRFAWLSMDST